MQNNWYPWEQSSVDPETDTHTEEVKQQESHLQAKGMPSETGGAHSSFQEEPTLPPVCL